MLRKLFAKLFGSSYSSKQGYGSQYGQPYGRKYSSDEHYKSKHGAPSHHNQYGHGHYKKKNYSSSSWLVPWREIKQAPSRSCSNLKIGGDA